MAPVESLLSPFENGGRHSYSRVLADCRALVTGGIDHYKAMMASILESQDGQKVNQAKKASQHLVRLARMVEATDPAIKQAFDNLQSKYLEARNSFLTDAKNKSGDKTKIGLLINQYTSYFLSAIARATALIPILQKIITQHSVANGLSAESPDGKVIKDGGNSEDSQGEGGEFAMIAEIVREKDTSGLKKPGGMNPIKKLK